MTTGVLEVISVCAILFPIVGFLMYFAEGVIGWNEYAFDVGIVGLPTSISLMVAYSIVRYFANGYACHLFGIIVGGIELLLLIGGVIYIVVQKHLDRE